MSAMLWSMLLLLTLCASTLAHTHALVQAASTCDICSQGSLLSGDCVVGRSVSCSPPTNPPSSGVTIATNGTLTVGAKVALACSGPGDEGCLFALLVPQGSIILDDSATVSASQLVVHLVHAVPIRTQC